MGADKRYVTEYLIIVLVCFTFLLIMLANLFLSRLSRGERSGRYGSEGGRDDPDRHERRDRDSDRDYDRRWSGEWDRFDEGRESPEVSGMCLHPELVTTGVCNIDLSYVILMILFV